VSCKLRFTNSRTPNEGEFWARHAAGTSPRERRSCWLGRTPLELGLLHRVFTEFIGSYRNTDKFSTQSHSLLPQSLLNDNFSSTYAELHAPAISSPFNLKCNNRLWKVYIIQNRLSDVEINRSAFQIFDKEIWYLWTESFKWMSVLQVTKALRNRNACNFCNGWSENLTPLLACTFEHKGNKTGAPDSSSTMINYNLCNPSQDQRNKPANVL
jgi:hypothetical protein